MGSDSIITPKEYRVSLLRNNCLEYPELWMEVFIAGDKHEERAFAEMFVQARCSKADDPLKADFVVFTGGADVNPIYYDEERHPLTRIDSRRDEEDLKLYELCLNNGIPMFGVCRGAQFLHVMNGGKLYQDVDNHVGDHAMWDTKANKIIRKVSSVHHQMCIRNPTGGMIVLADSGKATKRWKNPTDTAHGSHMDVEAFFYRDTCCLGVQGHPEYKGYNEFMKWTLDQINELIVCNPDVELVDRYRRLKLDVREMRDKKWAEKVKELN